MGKVQGLKPIYDNDSKILILGTFPSEKSRETGEYYADGRNRFWTTICESLGVDVVPKDYEKKKQLLKDNHIALWDLVESCEIGGSNDKDIKNPVPNNIEDLLNKADFELIILNGKRTALKMMRELYGDSRTWTFGKVGYICNCSTSGRPAHFKKEQWITTIRTVLGII